MDRKLQKRLADGAQITANVAKEISAVWSTKVPAATKVVSNFKGVSVQTDGKLAHSGLPNELGSRHPVFGHRDRWSKTPLRPYMDAAAERTIDQVAEAAAGYLDDLTRDNGFTD
jgi:hypothetical protein